MRQSLSRRAQGRKGSRGRLVRDGGEDSRAEEKVGRKPHQAAQPTLYLGCAVSPQLSFKLFSFLFTGTQRLKKERRKKALRAGASRGGRKDAKVRGVGWSGMVEKTAEQRKRWEENPIRLNSLGIPYSPYSPLYPPYPPSSPSLLLPAANSQAVALLQAHQVQACGQSAEVYLFGYLGPGISGDGASLEIENL